MQICFLIILYFFKINILYFLSSFLYFFCQLFWIFFYFFSIFFLESGVTIFNTIFAETSSYFSGMCFLVAAFVAVVVMAGFAYIDVARRAPLYSTNGLRKALSVWVSFDLFFTQPNPHAFLGGFFSSRDFFEILRFVSLFFCDSPPPPVYQIFLSVNFFQRFFLPFYCCCTTQFVNS